MFLEGWGTSLAWQGINNHWVYNIFIFVEFNFLNYIYYRTIRNRRLKMVAGVYSLAYPVYFLINLIGVQGWQTFNTYPYVVGCIGIVLMVVKYFVELLIDPVFPDLKRQPMFWISTGLLFYCLGNIPMYGMINYLIHNFPVIARNFFIIGMMLNIVKFTFYIAGFLCGARAHGPLKRSSV
ncbi:hypothetical protein [Catalinimonas alkaloidigena]|nr:hypothetical protein [Catalinimonas alkaloidigena]